MTQKSQNRGVALVTTMAGLVVVIMMVGAFLATRQGFIASARFSSEQQACRDTVRSLADFCRFRLEGEEGWGRSSTSSVEFRDGTGEVVLSLSPTDNSAPEFADLPGESFYAGGAPKANVTIHMSVSNNLDNDTARNGVDAKSCILRIRASRGGASETVEVILRRASFFDSTVAASGDVEIKSDKVTFSSNDSLRNQIRSNSEIMLPDIPDIVFAPAPEMQTTEKGTVWAQGPISIAENSSVEKLNDAAAATGGEFLPNAPTRYEVPELKKSDLEADGSKPIATLRPVVYQFAFADVNYYDIDGNVRQRKIPLCVIGEPDWDESRPDNFLEFHYVPEALNAPLDPEDPQPLDHVPDLERPAYMEIGSMAVPTDGIMQPTGKFFHGGGEVHVPTTEEPPKVVFNAETDYRVKSEGGLPGDFKVYSVDLEAAELVFKDNDPDEDNPQEGLLSCERDCYLEGYVSNCGRLLAGRDVRLAPREVAVNKLEEQDDLAVFGGRDVLISPMFKANEIMEPNANRIFVFKGLVYAERDFAFRSSVVRQDVYGNPITQDFQRKLYIEGALVARQGEVFIQGNETVELKYNREYLDDLMEKSFEGDTVQLEELSWRPI